MGQFLLRLVLISAAWLGGLTSRLVGGTTCIDFFGQVVFTAGQQPELVDWLWLGI